MKSIAESLVLCSMPKLLSTLLLFVLVTPLAADTTMQRKTAPPEPQRIDCSIELAKIQRTLIGIANDEADLSDSIKDYKSAAEYRRTATSMETAPWLKPSDESCGIRSIKLLRVMVAQWQFFYMQDYMYLHQGK